MKCTECRLWKEWMQHLDKVIAKDNKKREEHLNQEYLNTHKEVTQ